MTNRQEISIERVDAYKVFAETTKGLQSPFASKHKTHLVYAPEQTIAVDCEEEGFFAFANIRDAVRITVGGRRKWNVVSPNLIVLPVTLWDVFSKGKFHVLSDDPQCLDGYYEAYESKRIMVHDNPFARQRFHEEVLKSHFAHAKYGCPHVVKQSLIAQLPYLQDLLIAKRVA